MAKRDNKRAYWETYEAGKMMLSAAIKKNIKLMMSSKLTVGIIFLAPFLLLLIVQGVYDSSNSLDITVGVVENNDPLFESILDGIGDQFNIATFEQSDDCLESLKRGQVHVCIELDEREFVFHVDYSKIKLAEEIISRLSTILTKSSENVRIVFLEALIQKSTMMSDMLRTLADQYETSLTQDNPLENLDDMNAKFTQTRDSIQEIRLSLDEVSRESHTTYEETESSLGSFSNQLGDVQNKAEYQQGRLSDIRENAYNCEGRYLPPLTDFDSMTDAELQNVLVHYGECKCVEQYEPVLISAEGDLGDVVDYTDNAQDEIDNSKQRNKQFYQITSGAISLQKRKLSSFEDQAGIFENEINSLRNDLQNRLDVFGISLRNLSEYASTVSSQIGNEGGALSDPLMLTVSPLSIERELIVYMFPLLLLLIMMFISLLFSSSFAYNEKTSLATNRNKLSPLLPLVHFFGLFFCLIIVLLVQVLLMLLLSNIFFPLALTFGMILKILVVTSLFLATFVFTGLIIGKIMKSQLVVVLVSIGVTVFCFLYSSMTNPVEMMDGFVKLIVSINPYVIAGQNISTAILYNSPLSVGWLIVSTLVMGLIAIVVYRK